AAEEIAAGIAAANQLREPLDALVVGRGGGSLEDLWCFNEEVVVRAIAASRVPVISAVGHEIDVTLSDLVADVRALTPSEAAERVAPSADDLIARVRTLEGRLHGAARRRVAIGQERVERVSRSRPFARPHAIHEDRSRRLDEIDRSAQRAVRRLVERGQDRLAAVAGKLESLSPLGVLQRGYSLTTDANGKVVRSIEEIDAGDRLKTRLAEGEIIS
ncbi:unnamed protein product, partial [Ectocarpus sp. 4 AP-2014]